MPLILNGSTGVLDGLMVSSSNLTSDAVYLTAPAGAVCFVAQNTAPTGWLKANGAAVSRTTYAALFTALGTTFGSGNGSTTFNLPDLRGEFPRSWDDGRGVDSGRGFGSVQSGQQADHTHTAPSHYHQMPMGFDGGAFYGWQDGAQNPIYGSTVASGTNRTIVTASTGYNQSVRLGYTDTAGASGTSGASVVTSDNVRPRNIALLALIKF